MKTNKIVEVSIWILVLISLISGMFYFTNGRHWIAYKKPTANRSTIGLQEMKREKADTSKIDQIELCLRDADVVISCVEGNEIEVIEYAKDDDEQKLFKMSEDGDTLKFEREYKEHFGMIFGEKEVQHYIEVKLPKEFKRHLVIENSSGNVALADAFVFDELELETTSGNISINDVEAECEIGATSGDIYIEKLDATEVNLGATSGNMTLEEIKGDLNAGTTSGDIFIGRIEGKKHEIGCTSGKVTVEDGKGDFEIETTSGDVFLKKVSGSKHKIETTSGDIDIQEGKGEFDTETNSGDVRKEHISE